MKLSKFKDFTDLQPGWRLFVHVYECSGLFYATVLDSIFLQLKTSDFMPVLKKESSELKLDC